MRVMARGERLRPLLNNEFDGDMCSATAVLTDDGIEEIKHLLSNKDYYVGVTGKMTASASTDIANLVFLEMTA